jgi:shikimate dehydrogenase
MSYEITGHTRLGGLIGTPVSHSISPMMYNESFRILGLDFVYLCFDSANARLEDMIRAMRDLNVFGFNVTMPHKEHVLQYLDDLSPAAKMIGAVNTVKNDNGHLTGHNTDGIGYMHSLAEQGYDVKKGAMTLLGAGGAASSIAIQAALDGVPKLHIVNRRGRSWDNAIRLADEINHGTDCQADVTDLADLSALRRLLEESTLLTNATSIGMAAYAGQSPIADPSMLHPDLLVSDVIYNPRRTKLLADAAAAGCRTFNGMYMLLYQGVAAFSIWTGQDMPVETIRAKYFS